MMQENKLLIVDDDLRLRNLLSNFLSQNHFSVQGVGSGSEMDLLLAQYTFDLVILDIMLPEEDGLSICYRVHKEYPDLGIIMLTARDQDDDKITGLGSGADDYLSKPFNPKELLARIHAVLRRKHHTSCPPHEKTPLFQFGDYCLDIARRTLTHKNRKIPLTSAEFTLLKILVEHANRPLTRDQLMTLSKGRECNAFDRSIDMMISRLRKLIETNPSKPQFIQTVWGHGYVFVLEAHYENPIP